MCNFTLSDPLWEKLKAEAPLHHRRRAELAFQAGYEQAIKDLRFLNHDHSTTN